MYIQYKDVVLGIYMIYLSLHCECNTWGGVFLGVKNNSKSFGNNKNIRFLGKIFSECT